MSFFAKPHGWMEWPPFWQKKEIPMKITITSCYSYRRKTKKLELKFWLVFCSRILIFLVKFMTHHWRRTLWRPGYSIKPRTLMLRACGLVLSPCFNPADRKHEGFHILVRRAKKRERSALKSSKKFGALIRVDILAPRLSSAACSRPFERAFVNGRFRQPPKSGKTPREKSSVKNSKKP